VSDRASKIHSTVHSVNLRLRCMSRGSFADLGLWASLGEAQMRPRQPTAMFHAPPVEHWRSTRELGSLQRFSVGLCGLERIESALRNRKERGERERVEEDHTPPNLVGGMRFKVCIRDKSGETRPQLLELNVSTGSLRVLGTDSRNLVLVSQISQIEKTSQDSLRVLLVFFGDFRPPQGIIFTDRTTRDCFCELMKSLNPNIVFKVWHRISSFA